MARVVEAVQIFKKVEDVTAAKDDPSPVYLMDELAEMARGSAESSEKIADRIAKRLQHKSPVAKFKALRLIRHIVNKGCGQFQRSMQRHASLVRDLIHFKGEPDPYKGDAPNQRVRDAAKEASESLFNTIMAQPVSSLGSRIQGFGSSAAPVQSSNQLSHGSGGSVSGSRMVGFGSSGNMAAAASAASSGNGSSGFGNSSQKGVNRPLTGTYGDAAPTSAGGSSRGGYGGYAAPALTAAEVLGSEAQLVDSICTPGGLRLAPDADDLRRFVEAAGSLDGLRVAEMLRDKMDSSGPWQQQLRALYALEAVLLQGATQACGEIAVMFQSDPGPVQAAAGHTQPAVRERASQVLKLLLGDSQPAAAAAPAPVAAAPAATGPAAARQTTGDLLGGLDFLGSPVHGGQGAAPQQQPQQHQHAWPQAQQQQQSVAASGAGAGLEDMFSGLAVPAGPGPQQQPQQQPPPGGPGAYPGQPSWQHQGPPPAQQPVAPGAGRPPVDPFGTNFLEVAPPPQQQQQQQQQALYGPPPALQQHHHQQQQAPFLHPHPHQQQPQQHQHPYAPRPAPQTGAAGGLAPPGQVAQAAAQAVQPAAGTRPPLDDMFADMSLSGSATRPPAPSAGTGTAYGVYGSGGGHAYGATSTGAGQGYGNPQGSFGVAPPSQAPLQGGMGMGMGMGMGAAGVQLQYTAAAGMSAPAPPHPHPQPHSRPAAPSNPADTQGGLDMLGMGLDMGPSAAAVPATRPGPAGWSVPNSGLYGTGAGGLYGTGAGVSQPGPSAAGVGMMSMGVGAYAGAPSGGVGPGVGHGIGLADAGLGGGGVGGGGAGGGGVGGMMVGPGGQVRYMGQGMPLPGSATGALGGSAPANGQLHKPPPQQQQQQQQVPGQAYGGWQQPYQSQQQHQQQQAGAGAFDFVRDHFK